MERESVLTRVKRLLEYANGLDNPTEAASYAAKATALIAQYNVEQSELDDCSKDHNYVVEKFDMGGKQTWLNVLANALSNTHFCHAMRNTKNKREIVIVGEKHNIEVVVYLYNYLARQLRRMANIGYRESSKELSEFVWKRGFYAGAIDTIAARIRQERSKFEAAANTNRALVVVKDAKLKEVLDEIFPQRTPGRKVRNVLTEAYQKGVEVGEQIAIHQGVSTAHLHEQLV